MANFTRNSYILNLLKLRKESSQPVEHNFSVIFFYGRSDIGSQWCESLILQNSLLIDCNKSHNKDEYVVSAQRKVRGGDIIYVPDYIH